MQPQLSLPQAWQMQDSTGGVGVDQLLLRTVSSICSGMGEACPDDYHEAEGTIPDQIKNFKDLGTTEGTPDPELPQWPEV